MKFEYSACSVEPIIEDVVEDELEGEDVKVGGELVETGKANELESKSIKLLSWLPHFPLSFQFEAVNLTLKPAQLPTFFRLVSHISLWPENELIKPNVLDGIQRHFATSEYMIHHQP